MLECALCSTELGKARVCLNCAKGYCDKEDIRACEFCGGPVLSICIQNEDFDDTIVQWASFRSRRIGPVDFDEIPKIVPRLLDSKTNYIIAPNQEVLLFPTKESSWRTYKVFDKKFGRQEVELGEYRSRWKKTLPPVSQMRRP